MDIFRYLFNFGDNYYQSTSESIWIKVLPVFFSGLLSFAITYFMFRHQNRVKEIEEKKRIADLKEYIYYCLDAILKLIGLQIEGLEEFIDHTNDDIAKKHVLNRNVGKSVGLNLRQIKKLDVNDTFKILVANEENKEINIRNYQFLIGSGEHLEKIHSSLELINSIGGEKYDTCKKALLVSRADFNEVIRDLRKQFQKMRPKSDTITYEYINNILSIWGEFALNSSMNLEDLQIKLTSPIMQFCGKQIINDDIFEIPQTRQILTICQNINIQIAEMILNKRDQIELAIGIKNDLENIKVVYKDIIDKVFPEKQKQ